VSIFSTAKGIFGQLHFPLPFVSNDKALDSTNNNKPDQHVIAYTVRSRLKLAGAFVFVSVIGIIGLGLHSDSAAKQSAPTNLQISNNSADIPVVTPVTNPPNSTSTNISSSTSTNSNSPNNSGGGSASVTVNGQPVNVPSNGSTQQTITTPNGQTNVSVTSTQSNNNDSSSFHQTNLNVSTSTSSNTTEDNTAP